MATNVKALHQLFITCEQWVFEGASGTHPEEESTQHPRIERFNHFIIVYNNIKISQYQSILYMINSSTSISMMISPTCRLISVSSIFMSIIFSSSSTNPLSNINAILVSLMVWICYSSITMFYISGDSGMNPHRLVAHWMSLAIATPHASSSLDDSIDRIGSRKVMLWFFNALDSMLQMGLSP